MQNFSELNKEISDSSVLANTITTTMQPTDTTETHSFISFYKFGLQSENWETTLTMEWCGVIIKYAQLGHYFSYNCCFGQIY